MGFLKYLEEIDATRSMWKGGCFVFDQRVSIEHGLEIGDHDLCYACGLPLSGG